MSFWIFPFLSFVAKVVVASTLYLKNGVRLTFSIVAIAFSTSFSERSALSVYSLILSELYLRCSASSA